MMPGNEFECLSVYKETHRMSKWSSGIQVWIYCSLVAMITVSRFGLRIGVTMIGIAFKLLVNIIEHLATSVNIVFPVIHGRFGEDGGIQELLENSNIPFVGTRSRECRTAFDKGSESDESELSKWFVTNQLHVSTGKVVVKPTIAGSSIGVTVAYGVSDTLNNAYRIISVGIDDKVLVEIFLEGGREFTAIVLDVGSGSNCQLVVLLPTEVDLQSHGTMDVNEKDAIFNYRRKYLPTKQVSYHTPPRFPLDIIETIRQGASLVFQQLGLHDFARIDGWFLPPDSHASSLVSDKFGKSGMGTVLFTDINLVTGMEQTSFLFQQASKVGFSHSNILRTIIQRACLRYPNILPYNILLRSSSETKEVSKDHDKQKVYVIFCGDSSERQVSLMSGTNVWLNLQTCDDVELTPCLLAPVDGYSSDEHSRKSTHMSSWTVWQFAGVQRLVLHQLGCHMPPDLKLCKWIFWCVPNPMLTLLKFRHVEDKPCKTRSV